MNIKERFALLRSTLDVSQEEFGEAIGLSKSGVSSIENGSRNVTNKHIKLLVAAYNVNEEWLRHGIGEMFIPNDDSLLAKLADEYHMTESQKRIITAFCHMDAQKRESVSQAFFTFIDALQQNSATTTTSNTTVSRTSSDDDLELKHRQDIIAVEFEAEKKGKMSLASTGTSGYIKKV